MEPKKNPKYDVHRKRGVLLNVGLIVSLILVITALKWKVPVGPIIDYSFEDPSAEGIVSEDPRITDFKGDEPPKPKPIKPVVLVPTIFVETDNPQEDPTPTAGPDQGIDPPQITIGTIDIPVETPQPDTFILVEKMPEPVGGWPAFYKTLSKNIKYPRQAERIGATGKVFVEFVVNEKGELSNLKILKGIGHGCDEEAKRVLSMTKWNAGKQRGRAVNVKMVQPINFSIN